MVEKAFPLLSTKLLVPPLRPSLVTRSHLLVRLSDSLNYALTLVCAPAGYGKTTLLSEWIQNQRSKANANLHFAWISLDPEDNDPLSFISYLTAALPEILPGIAERVHPLLGSFPPPSLPTLLAFLVNSLAQCSASFLLVLDDYQFIENKSIHDAIVFLLDRMPPKVHLVLATRSDPPIPLARLRARNQLLEFRAEDLRFTMDEAVTFLNQSMGLSLSRENIVTLDRRTEGWIAGLQMAALSMRGQVDLDHFVEAFSGSHRYILDYLAEEALGQLPADVLRFLLRTSILERLSGPLCDVLLVDSEPRMVNGSDSQLTIHGSQSSQSILEYLDRANLFLVSLDNERCWFRYHHLFADLLRARLQQSYPSLIPELHRRASDWYTQNGFIVEAIQHSLAAKDYQRAATMIEHHGALRWSAGDPSILLWADHLPPEMLSQHPKVGIYQAWFLIAQGLVQTARTLLEGLEAEVQAMGNDPKSSWMLAVIELLLAYAASTAAGTIRAGLPDDRLLDMIPKEDLGLRNTADYLYAILLNRKGEIVRSVDLLRRSIQRAQSSNTMVVLLLARCLMMLGRLPEAAELCRAYLDHIQAEGKEALYSAGALNIVLGEVLYEWDDLDGAEHQIRKGIQANAPWHNIVLDVIGYSDLITLQSARGDLTGAAETMQQLDNLLQGRTDIADVEEELDTIRVRLWLARGEVARAEAWADRVAEKPPVNYLQDWRHISLARVRIVQGRYREAQQILEALSSQSGADQRLHRQVRIDLFLAIALFKRNQRVQAFEVLEACLRRAQPGGYCRLFLDLGLPVKELLLAYLCSSSPGNKAFAQNLVETFPSGPAHQPPFSHQELPEPLTPREVDVLALMVAGLTNREIAEALVISEGTVKYHVHAILEKLGVHHRTQAIRKAREQKLI